MAVGDIISATRYNQLQGRISSILGPGSGNKGYNQSVQSNVVPTSGIVYASHMNNLYTDTVKVYAHQNGILPVSIYEVATEDDITDALYNEFNTIITAAEASPQRFVVHSTQAVVESAGINTSRTAAWGGTSQPQAVVHEFTATFSNSTAQRAFFNAGGEIRIDLSLTHNLTLGDPDYAKTNDWQNMIAAMGTIVFKHNSTSAGTGTGSAIGNFQLTTSYQQVFRKTGSGVYVDNDVTVLVKKVSDNKIAFKITLLDDANGAGGADERVRGTVLSSVTQYRSDGIYVDTPGPSWQNLVTLGSSSAGTLVGTDTTVCIAICDESSSQTAAGMATKWTTFRNHYPNRPFWLLQPGGTSQGNLYQPTSAWASDVYATGPVAVNRDAGNVAQASDWFDIAGLGLLASGSKVALSVDGSGSMTVATVQASYNLFKSKCAAAGLIVVELGMSNEDWITPFDIII
jgi:hypothetical protein